MLAEFKKLLEEYPDALQEKKRFRALLYDYFPTKRREANALYMALELGIPDDMLELQKVRHPDSNQSLVLMGSMSGTLLRLMGRHIM